MGKVYTRFLTKTAQKTLPVGAAHTNIAYIREYPPPLGVGLAFDTRKTAFFGLLRTSAPQISEIIFLHRIDLIAKKALERHCKPLVDLSKIGTSLIAWLLSTTS